MLFRNTSKSIFLQFIGCFLTPILAQQSFEIDPFVTPIQDSIFDIDSNVYHPQKIGDQIWFMENLKTTRFSDGTPIAFLQDDSLWNANNIPAYCHIPVENKSNSDSILSELTLYNFWVVNASKNVCPSGWRVPDTADFKQLESYVFLINQEFTKFTIPYSQEQDSK